jgi:hypothetical protein
MTAATLRQTAKAEAIEKRAIHMEAFLHRLPAVPSIDRPKVARLPDAGSG